VTDSPRDDRQSLPDGIEALRALLLTMMSERDTTLAELDAAVTERDILLAQNDRLRHLLLQLRRLQFCPRSERLPEEQLQLGLEAFEQAIAKEHAEAEKRDAAMRRDNAARRRASRGALPAHLPRIEVTLAPEDTACPCCRATMTVIGEDTSERLDVIPAQFRVIVTKRPKLACRACTGTVVQAPAPARLIEGGIPTEALVAHGALCRSSAPVSPGADHGATGRDPRALHALVLDGVRRGGSRPRGGAAARDDAGLDTDLCRRDRGAGARSRPRTDQAGLLLGDGP
jgi:transposase